MSRSAAHKSGLLSLLAIVVAGLGFLAAQVARGPLEPERMLQDGAPAHVTPGPGDAQTAQPSAPVVARRAVEESPATDAKPGDHHASDGTATITVRGQVTGAGLGEALVSFFALDGPSSLGRAQRTITDETGSFVCRGLEPGSFELVVTRRGVVELAREISLHADTNLGELALAAALRADSPRDGGGPRWVGQVRDAATGAPVAGARARWRDEQETISGVDGRFALAGIAALSAHEDDVLVVSHPDYASRRVALPEGRELGQLPIEVALDRLEVRRGRITDRLGAPVEGAQVEVFVRGLAHALPSEIALSDGQGEFSLGLRDGCSTEAGRPRELYVTHADFAPARSDVPGPDEPLRIVLDDGARVAGTVTDADGVAVAGARVHVRGADAERTTSSAHDGSFGFERLEPGAYELRVEAAGFASPAPRSCAFVAGDQRCNVSLAPGVALAGRVVDERGRAVPSARVRVLGGSGSAAANATGEFRLEGLDPGATCEIEASAPGHAATVLSLAVANAETATVVLPRAASLVACVFDRSSGLAVAGAHVLLRASESPGTRATATPLARCVEEGESQAGELAPGAYSLEAQADGHSRAAVDVWLRAGENARVEIALERGVRIAGRLVDELGRGLAGGQLSWTPLEVDARPQVVSTSEGGAFTVVGLAPGAWSVGIEHPQLAFVLPRRIEVVAGAGELVIELDAGDGAIPLPDSPEAATVEAR